MFSVKTLDSFQVIPIPVSKENLSAVYKLKKKKVEFSLFYITQTYRCRSPKFMLNLLNNTARKYKQLQQLGCIQFGRHLQLFREVGRTVYLLCIARSLQLNPSPPGLPFSHDFESETLCDGKLLKVILSPFLSYSQVFLSEQLQCCSKVNNLCTFHTVSDVAVLLYRIDVFGGIL